MLPHGRRDSDTFCCNQSDWVDCDDNLWSIPAEHMGGCKRPSIKQNMRYLGTWISCNGDILRPLDVLFVCSGSFSHFGLYLGGEAVEVQGCARNQAKWIRA